MRVVLDTSVMVAAIRSNAGASNRLLAAGLGGRITLLVSVPPMFEYQAVMTRAEHLVASGLSSDEVEVLLDAVAAVASPVRFAFVWRPASSDPGDDMVLETAVNGRAHALVTFNVRHLNKAAKSFGIETLSPGEALRRLESGR